MPGGDIPLQLRSLSDATRLRDAGSQSDAVVVIGAGFIGCEAAASLAMRGVATTLVAPDSAPQGKRLGADAGARLRRMVQNAGVRYVGGVSVQSVERVYAAGDVALAFNAGAGRHVAVEHWQDAVDHGAVTGASAAQQWAEWDAVPGFWTTIGDAPLKYHAWGRRRSGSRSADLRVRRGLRPRRTPHRRE